VRKSIILSAGAIAVLIVVVLIFMFINPSTRYARYHQHLRNPGEADLGICEVCSEDILLCTHLPIIMINTFGQEIPGRPLGFGMFNPPLEMHHIFHTTAYGETEIDVHVSVIDNTGQWNHNIDTPMFESSATMRIRGNSSRFFDKPNYRIRLVDENDQNNRLPLLGMDPGHEWALHGPFLDKTLMRNYMWMNIASEIMQEQFVPEVRFFELILNGEFQGLYVLMETLRVETSRLNLNRYRPGMPQTSYFFGIEPRSNPGRRINTFGNYTLRLELGRDAEILYPTYANQSEMVQNYIMGSINTFERFLFSPEYIRHPRQIENFIDINSFVNYFIINEFVMNNDLFANSTFFHKDVRGRLVAGPVWDFNNVLDNFFTPFPYDEFMLVGRGWFDRLMMSPYFTERVINRWHELRRDLLSEDRLLQYMDEVEQWLGSAIDRNFEVWGFSFDYNNLSLLARRRPRSEDAALGVTVAELNPASFEEAMEQMREVIINRGLWMDANIETLRKYSHPSRHALWQHP